ncbi:MAG TPA: 3',5'-cyclic-AMP phosphodiesterase [Candidatus Competibacteraceae bacterium]|nr:3',5'-cyclic-AMP phosphodiesterase [Candidatus Competibacteraceae bacterium]
MSTLDSAPLYIVQITDTHIQSIPGALLSGADVDANLDRVLRHIRLFHPDADLVLATGDLVQDEGAPAYERVRNLLSTLGKPVYCLPGNHDMAAILDNVLSSGAVRRERHLKLRGWQILLLDSSRPGSPDGHLAQSELVFLDRTLSTHAEPALVCLHHQPVPVGSAWLDTMVVDNAGAFFRILDRHPQVRAVLFGHVHQAFNGERNGVKILGTPATCVQFKPGSASFAVDSRPPGYRVLTLYPDSQLHSEVEWVR